MAGTRPEKEFRPATGVKVVLWNNGPRGYSVQIPPKQYKNTNGEWTDGAFFPADLLALQHGIQRAIEYIDQMNDSRVLPD